LTALINARNNTNYDNKLIPRVLA